MQLRKCTPVAHESKIPMVSSVETGANAHRLILATQKSNVALTVFSYVFAEFRKDLTV